MSDPRYATYAHSGIDWLQEVPAHWDIVRLRDLARRERDAFTDGNWIESPYITDDGVRLIQTGNIGVGEFKEQGFRYVSEATFVKLKCNEVDAGDVLICRLADPVGRACIAPSLATRMIASVDVCMLKPNGRSSAAFIVYMLSSAEYLGFMESRCRGGTRDRVSRSFLGSVRIAVPPLEEQVAITSFLDRETAKIDALVAEQRRLIELLKEKRQAVISHAVTKGLNPKARLKPSGVQWIGSVPEHWKVSRIKWVAKMESGHTPDRKVSAYWQNCDIPWVSLNDTKYLKDHEYISDTALKVNGLGLANSSARLLPARAVVFSRDATIGRCAITTREMAVSQHFIAWLCSDQVVPEYLLFCLRSMAQELDRMTAGATLKTIGMPDVKTLAMPVPPVEEQHDVASWIGENTRQSDALISEAERAIALLQERRTALISAAVTGKIDVRDFAYQESA